MPNRFSRQPRQQGFSAIFVSFLVAFSTLAISVNIFLVASNSQRIVANNGVSLQALYAAESGIEDATFRIKNLLPYASAYTVPVGKALAQVTVTSDGNVRTVESEGTAKNNTRKLQAILTLSTIAPQFFFGVQVGEGGVIMGENSRIEGAGGTAGNFYSNGTVTGGNGATITGDVTVAGTNSIDKVVVYGTARAHSITNSEICGNAYYQSTSTIDASSKSFLDSPTNPTCGGNPLTPGTGFPNQPDPAVSSFPISQGNIDQWKADAANGGTITGNCGDDSQSGGSNPACTISNNGNLFLGPKKITGNLVLTKKQTLTITGTLYIQGNIDFDSASGATVKCDPSFAANSCLIVTDGWVHIKNNAVFQGSGVSGSYVMFLTTLTGCNGGVQQSQCTHHNAAIDLHNNATGAIFYTANSMANLHNGVNVSEITAYKFNLGNNAVVTYEQGLLNAQFSSGPGATFKVVSWKEIE